MCAHLILYNSPLLRQTPAPLSIFFAWIIHMLNC